MRIIIFVIQIKAINVSTLELSKFESKKVRGKGINAIMSNDKYYRKGLALANPPKLPLLVAAGDTARGGTLGIGEASLNAIFDKSVKAEKCERSACMLDPFDPDAGEIGRPLICTLVGASINNHEGPR